MTNVRRLPRSLIQAAHVAPDLRRAPDLSRRLLPPSARALARSSPVASNPTGGGGAACPYARFSGIVSVLGRPASTIRLFDLLEIFGGQIVHRGLAD